jgi:hypothetical protein
MASTGHCLGASVTVSRASTPGGGGQPYSSTESGWGCLLFCAGTLAGGHMPSGRHTDGSAKSGGEHSLQRRHLGERSSLVLISVMPDGSC